MSDIISQLTKLAIKFNKDTQKTINEHLKKCIEEQTKIGGQLTVMEDWQPIYGPITLPKDIEYLYMVSCISNDKEVIKFGYTGNINERMAWYRTNCKNVLLHDTIFVHSNGIVAETQLLEHIKQTHQPCFGYEWFDMPVMMAKKLFYGFREQYERKIHCDIKEFERSAFRYMITGKEKYSDEELLILNEFISMKEFLDDVRNIFSSDESINIVVPWEMDRIVGEKIYKIDGTITRENIIMPVRACNMRNDLKCITKKCKRGNYYFFKSNDMIFCADGCVWMFDKFDTPDYNDVEYHDNDDNLVTDHKK